MDPYVTDRSEIPAADPYADLPLYGRYAVGMTDFYPHPLHHNSHTRESLQYWKSILNLCNANTRVRPPKDGRRDVFAIGGVIVKSSHLSEPNVAAEIGYRFADENEMQATTLARLNLTGIQVPAILWCGQIDGRVIMVQNRIPGVALDVAWPYLTEADKSIYKDQAREILVQLHAVRPPAGYGQRRHLVRDPNIRTNGRISPVEADILFSTTDGNTDLAFMHNNFATSNLIIQDRRTAGIEDPRIAGVINWDNAGYFGWKTAGRVHRWVRTPQPEDLLHSNMSEEKVRALMWWSDLYDEGMPADA